MRGGVWAGIFFGPVIALLLTSALGFAAGAKHQMTAEAVKQAIDKNANSVQLVTFPDTGWAPVKLVRGNSPAKDKNPQPPGAEKAEIAELVTFGDLHASPVRIVRGETDHAAATPWQSRPAKVLNMQVVTFADPRDRPVSILRGSVSHAADTELFGPASIADLDHVAFAVDGAESSHGADVKMWRPEPAGPQGPMQVTAAAAIDVGGGDRFDLAENRTLGRAYLARMYRRYGNWPDAVAAYNWGPGNVDSWISGGRAAHGFPLEVERYRDRVLREAAVVQPVMSFDSNSPFRDRAPPAPAAVHVASVIGALQRAVSVGDFAIHELIATVLTRAASWQSSYSALGTRITRFIEIRPRPSEELETEYVVSAGPGDLPRAGLGVSNYRTAINFAGENGK